MLETDLLEAGEMGKMENGKHEYMQNGTPGLGLGIQVQDAV